MFPIPQPRQCPQNHHWLRSFSSPWLRFRSLCSSRQRAKVSSAYRLATIICCRELTVVFEWSADQSLSRSLANRCQDLESWESVYQNVTTTAYGRGLHLCVAEVPFSCFYYSVLPSFSFVVIHPRARRGSTLSRTRDWLRDFLLLARVVDWIHRELFWTIAENSFRYARDLFFSFSLCRVCLC